MNNNIKEKKGYGSFFSHIDSEFFKDFPNSFIPKNNKLFYSGRHAIKYIIENINKINKVNIIWVPEYYCQHVTHWLKQNYNNIKFYEVKPANNSYIIDGSNFLKENDIILINNFWGTSECLINYTEKNFQIVEDHSHGWLSKSCIESNADFCFASLRKSVPTPLGGIAWIPNGDKLGVIEVNGSDYFKNIWTNISNAMLKKQEFEKKEGIDEDLKKEFLELVYDAENKMHNNYDLFEIDTKHKVILKEYLKHNYLDFKKNNFEKIVKLINQNNKFSILNNDTTPFGLTLLFQNIIELNEFKEYLIFHSVYPSLLWPNNSIKYGYFLNIHVDYRYNNLDIEYIASVINNYFQKQ
ncbi:hypothetical protein [uncultured Algibacter sp.]|uniref:hypothetical protein n=1 Tax=uncultured Algibacter sp. TaxID=298659 RepID=UPI00260B5550|nr:hypothetical protein [uncultured Algibacter sp.]